MNEFFTAAGILILVLMIPVLLRVIWGPTVIDRMIGANIIGTKTTVILILIGTLYQRLDMFVDLALTYALLNFLGSLASARLILRRKAAGADSPSENDAPRETKP